MEAYGKLDAALWILYAQFEQGRGLGTGNIYWRATKDLENPAAFVAEMSALG